MSAHKTIALVEHRTADSAGDCSGAESFALQVLGDSMAPEFVDGDVIIVESDGLVRDGSYVLAQVDGEWALRRLVRTGDGWKLLAENPAYPETALADLSSVRGVIIQKSRPGHRRSLKRYVD
ncbi:MAG: S24 family peptidase [Burkholderiales bacterium]|nr:S24 family peptidase [Burkholderiales bacterium]